MLKKLSKKLGVKIEKSTIIYLTVIVFGLLFIITHKTLNNSLKVTGIVDSEHINELFDQIGDNYSLRVSETRNDKTTNLSLSCDSRIKLYEGTMIDKDGYLIYNNKVFELNGTDLSRSSVDVTSFDNIYMDINFIKKVVKHCDYEYVNPVKATCSVKISDYLKEYNEYRNTELSADYDNLIKFDIIYYSDILGKINVDYTDINRIISYDADDLKYGIKIVDVNENNFDELYDYSKDILED